MRTSVSPASREPKKPRGKFRKGRKVKFYDKHPEHPETAAWQKARLEALQEFAASI